MGKIDINKGSEYMQWAKTQMQARFNIANSGVMFYPLKDLGASFEDLEINGPSHYGYEPLQKELAEKCAVPMECIAAATGTSMANQLAMSAILNPGDEVLIEQPTYDPLVAVARYLRANIKRFPRTFENSFGIDLDLLRQQITARTRLIVISSLHNPSGMLVPSQVLKEIGTMAKRAGARVLVDEVYLECLYLESGTPASAFHLGNEFVTTNSLTKAYGLNGLRCGWVLAETELIQKIWHLNDLFGVIPAHPAEILSVIALRNISKIAARANNLLQTNRPILNEFFDQHTDKIEVVKPEYGTIAFPRLKHGNADDFCKFLLEKYETLVVPGRFFDMPNHFRVGIGSATENFRAGIERLSEALKKY
ncbi:pyridoxal phosphate-dependent aminotransferase [bacterium]|nr:pyridoxal phosphate-dependent aminotransferase [bacterium]